MLVATMNENEILNEVKLDYDNCINYFNSISNKYRRAVIKSSSFPMKFKPVEFVTKRKNKCLVFIEAKSKKDRDNLFITIMFYFNKPDGIHAVMPVPDIYGMNINIYTPHFWKRYKERFIKNQVSTLDAIKIYFNNNPTSTGRTIENGTIQASVQDGIIFLNRINNDISIVKTFVNREQLFENQTLDDSKNTQQLEVINQLKKKYRTNLYFDVAS